MFEKDTLGDSAKRWRVFNDQESAIDVSFHIVIPYGIILQTIKQWYSFLKLGY
jgi:hypothetical protein